MTTLKQARDAEAGKVSRKDARYLRESQEMDAIRDHLNATAAIRACPWCAGRPEVVGTHLGTDWVACDVCGVEGPHQGNYSTAKGRWRQAAARAIARWNNGLFNCTAYTYSVKEEA